MGWRVLFVALATWLAPVSLAQAQGADAAAVDPAALAAARRVVVASGGEAMFMQNIERMIPIFVGPMARERGLSQDQAGRLARIIIEEAQRDPGPLLDMLARSYASRLSAEELNAAADFYESPAGARLVEMTPLIQNDMVDVGRVWGRDVLLPRLMRRMDEIQGTRPPGPT